MALFIYVLTHYVETVLTLRLVVLVGPGFDSRLWQGCLRLCVVVVVVFLLSLSKTHYLS